MFDAADGMEELYVPTKSSLREYHLLVIRLDAGFKWELRFNEHARPVRTSKEVWACRDDAEREGTSALEAFKAELLAGG